jgi:ferrous iron transport protein A
MRLLNFNRPEFNICNPDCNGRILNCDQYGRSLDADRRNLLPFRRIQGARRVSVLSDLKVGETGILVALDLPESVQNHLMHMGFVPDAEVTVLRRAPAGDPTVYSIDGMEIALRHETADSIRVRTAENEAAAHGGLHLAAHPAVHESTHSHELVGVGR